MLNIENQKGMLAEGSVYKTLMANADFEFIAMHIDENSGLRWHITIGRTEKRYAKINLVAPNGENFVFDLLRPTPGVKKTRRYMAAYTKGANLDWQIIFGFDKTGVPYIKLVCIENPDVGPFDFTLC